MHMSFDIAVVFQPINVWPFHFHFNATSSLWRVIVFFQK